MNKIFKIVWNAARGKMMVVNEATSSVQTGKKAAVTVAVIGALAAGSAVAGTLVDNADYQLEESYVGAQVDENGTILGAFPETNGGALWFTKDANQTVSGVTFKYHAVDGVGGAMGVGTAAKNEIVVENSHFIRNIADGDGGAIANYKTMHIKDSVFDRNDADLDDLKLELDPTPIGGGAIALGAESTTLIERSHFEGNESEYRGGAIATRDAKDATLVGGTYKVVDSTFLGNESEGKGGAIYNTFYKDSTAGSGAGVEVTGSKFIGNEAETAGAIYNAGLVDGPDSNDASGGKMTITSSLFEKNHSYKDAGAIFNQGSMTINGGEFSQNVAEDGVGGAIATSTKATGTVIDGVTFTDNHATYDGGAIANYSNLSIDNAKFVNNTAQRQAYFQWADETEDDASNLDVIIGIGDAPVDSTAIGGGAIALGAVSGTTIVGTITNTVFENNESGTNGGAIATRQAKDATLKDATYKIVADFIDNDAEVHGGAIYNSFYKDYQEGSGRGVEVSGNFIRNDADGNGGAIYNAGLTSPDSNDTSGGVMTVTNSYFHDNTADGGHGGAIFNQGTLTVKDSIFDENYALTTGGAISISTASVSTTLENVEFVNNGSEYDGGAIANYSNLTIKNAVFKNNSAQRRVIDIEGEEGEEDSYEFGDPHPDDTAIGGGAIALGATSGTTVVGSITDTLFEGNISGRNGGAIATRQAKDATLVDATYKVSGVFKYNEAYENGGAIYNSFYKDYTEGSGAGVEVSGQFLNNKATDGGAIYNAGLAEGDTNDTSGGKMTIADSVFTGNAASGNGGAIYNAGTLILEGTNVFSGNTAEGEGADIYNVGTLTINGDTTMAGGLVSSAEEASVEVNEATLSVGGTTEIGTLTGSGATLNVTSTEVSVTGNEIADLAVTASGNVNDSLGGGQNAATALIDKVQGTGNVAKVELAEGLVAGSLTADVVTGDNGEVQLSGVKEGTNSVQKATIEMAAAAPMMMSRILMNDVRKRLGDIRASEGTHGAWARYDGGKMSNDADFENKFNTIQVGVDTAAFSDSTRFGVAFSYTKGDSEFGRGESDMDAFSLAAYGTWMADNGMFADVIARVATVDNDLTVDGGLSAKSDNRLYSLSGEFGWRLPVNDKFFVEPQAELTYTYVNSDSFMLGNANYNVDSTDSLVARIGFVAGLKCPENKGDVYVRVSGVHEFLGDSSVTASMNGMSRTTETNGKDTWVEFGIGGQYNINKNTYVYADVERTAGGELDTDWRANVGVRYAF